MMWRRSTASGSVQETSRGVDAFVREPGGELAQRSSSGAMTLRGDAPAAARVMVIRVREGLRRDRAAVANDVHHSHTMRRVAARPRIRTIKSHVVEALVVFGTASVDSASALGDV